MRHNPYPARPNPFTIDLTPPSGEAPPPPPALCTPTSITGLAIFLLILHALLFFAHERTAASAREAAHFLGRHHAGAAPAPGRGGQPPFRRPQREDCVLEAQWEAALAPGGQLPWSNPASYDSFLLAELARLGLPLTHGYYMETGAWKGEKLSHSWLFESHLCWTGLLVEPSAAFFECERNRPASTVIHAALVDAAHNGSQLAAGIDSTPTNSAPMDDSGVLAVKPNADIVPAYSIETLLAREGVGARGVTWWTLDVEGLELQVLRGLGEYRPQVVLMEVWDVADNKGAVMQLMKEAGYGAGRAVSNKGREPPIQDFLFLYEGL